MINDVWPNKIRSPWLTDSRLLQNFVRNPQLGRMWAAHNLLHKKTSQSSASRHERVIWIALRSKTYRRIKRAPRYQITKCWELVCGWDHSRGAKVWRGDLSLRGTDLVHGLVYRRRTSSCNRKTKENGLFWRIN